ncbi:MAG: enoyl-CoA hydratase/isomerase family protein [Gammaproteobacteria bacterium]|nr:enoyl-CoA hydratase/isomerase family protein [Gammaproteobacteria bacterium]
MGEPLILEDAMPDIHIDTDARGVVTFTIDRPRRRNALDSAAMSALADALGVVEVERGVRALVFRGAGGSFSAGRDLKEAADLAADRAMDQHAAWTDVFRRLRRLPFPSVAAVEGYAVAGGFTLAMGCDLVIAERGARFGALEMQNGFPAAVCTPILARLAPPRIGLELAMFGELVAAERLYEAGLVNRLADGAGGLAAAVAEFTDRIVSLDANAVRQTLETYRAAETMPLDQSLTLGLHLNQLLDAAGSFRKAGQAFAGKDGGA